MAETPAPRSGRVVRAGLAVATVGVGAGLAAIPVSNWLDQRDDLEEARQRRTELQMEIAEAEAHIERIVGAEGLEKSALCYGPFVEVGEEVYAVPGLAGCVTTTTTPLP